VIDYPNIYAAGDAGDYPLKQAFLALRQADAITESLHATIAEREPAFGFEPVSHYVLEQMSTGTYVQVPLEQPGKKRRFRSGTSPLWRMGKRMIGTYLPWRFGEGEPVHGDLPWRGLETGMKLMSDLFAR
jgi:NADH dehydrogenase FAD-containing subunit